jgi:RimJ/RimL family protein N-acetyltransferase
VIAVGKLGPRTLKGHVVSLEPLARGHYEALRSASNDPALWQYLSVDGSGEGFARWFDDALDEKSNGGSYTFAVRRLSDGVVVGTTRYMVDVPAHARVEIGWTWYVLEAQGTLVNPEAKLLLMANAFEDAGYNRVELKTDARNLRSRAAILKLGAKEEGILRAQVWMPSGYWRDSVYFSVLRNEWPEVKKRLQDRLSGSPS